MPCPFSLSINDFGIFHVEETGVHTRSISISFSEYLRAITCFSVPACSVFTREKRSNISSCNIKSIEHAESAVICPMINDQRLTVLVHNFGNILGVDAIS